MTKEVKQDLRYYIPLVMGFIIIIFAMCVPPLGVIPTSALYAAGMFLILCAAVVGLDIPAILHEVNELKRLSIKEITKNKTNGENE